MYDQPLLRSIRDQVKLFQSKESASDLHHLKSRCVRGEQEAWAELLSRFQELIYTIPRRKGLSREECDAIFHSTCISIALGLKKQGDVNRMPQWVASIAIHKTVDFLKEKDNHRRQHVDREYDDLEPSVQEEWVIREELRRLVGQGLSRLPLREQQIIRARFFQELDYESITKKYGIPKGAIGPTMNRALARLKRVLNRILEQV